MSSISHCEDVYIETVDKLKVRDNAKVCGDMCVRGTIYPLRSVEVGLSANSAPIESDAVERTQVLFNNVLSSHGLAYDNANSQFVAERDGIYSFSTTLNWTAGDDFSPRLVGLQVNGNIVHQTTNVSFIDASARSGDAAVLRLKKDDRVQVVAAQQNGLSAALQIQASGSLLIITQLR
jgi:hypothetical protein